MKIKNWHVKLLCWNCGKEYNQIEVIRIFGDMHWTGKYCCASCFTTKTMENNKRVSELLNISTAFEKPVINNNKEEKYWKEKVRIVSEISKEFGFPEQNEEFWRTQPAGVISLVCKVMERGISIGKEQILMEDLIRLNKILGEEDD